MMCTTPRNDPRTRSPRSGKCPRRHQRTCHCSRIPCPCRRCNRRRTCRRKRPSHPCSSCSRRCTRHRTVVESPRTLSRHRRIPLRTRGSRPRTHRKQGPRIQSDIPHPRPLLRPVRPATHPLVRPLQRPARRPVPRRAQHPVANRGGRQEPRPRPLPSLSPLRRPPRRSPLRVDRRGQHLGMVWSRYHRPSPLPHSQPRWSRATAHRKDKHGESWSCWNCIMAEESRNRDARQEEGCITR